MPIVSNFPAGGGKYKVQSKEAVPTKAQQLVTPDDGFYALSDVTVGAIPEQFVDTSDATAAATDIVSGKTAYANGKKVSGTVQENESGEELYLPAGASVGTVSMSGKKYIQISAQSSGVDTLVRSGSKVVSTIQAEDFGDADAMSVLSGKTFSSLAGIKVGGQLQTVQPATPSISVSSNGLITASVTQGSGLIESDGTKSATKQLTTQGAKTVTPKTYAQTAVSSGRYTTGAVTVAGDANLVASNIKSGVSIFGVMGTATTITSVSLNVYSSWGNGSVFLKTPDGFSVPSGNTTYSVPKSRIIFVEAPAGASIEPGSGVSLLFEYTKFSSGVYFGTQNDDGSLTRIRTVFIFQVTSDNASISII